MRDGYECGECRLERLPRAYRGLVACLQFLRVPVAAGEVHGDELERARHSLQALRCGLQLAWRWGILGDCEAVQLWQLSEAKHRCVWHQSVPYGERCQAALRCQERHSVLEFHGVVLQRERPQACCRA
jgi:hypothetical protein